MKVKPWVALLVLMIFGGIIGLKVWAGHQWRSLGGATMLHVDRQGQLWINIHEHLFAFNEQGEALAQYNLNAIDIEELAGGFAFFDNDEILLRWGTYDPSLINRILIFFRSGTENDLLKGDENKLVRCHTEAWHCQPLSNFPESFVRTFHLYIDGNNDIFVADTSNHRLFWLDEHGIVKDKITSGLRFPNQVLKYNGQLWLANTNRHHIAVIDIEEGVLQTDWREISMKNEVSSPLDEIWPVNFAIINEQLFVLSQGNNLMRGSVYAYDLEGELLQRFDLGGDSDPVAMTAFRGEILVSDYSRMVIERFDMAGNKLGEFDPQVLKSITLSNKIKQQEYKQLDQWSLYLFVILMIPGFIVAAVLDKKHREETQQKSTEQQAGKISGNIAGIAKPEPDDTEIIWLEVKDKFKKQLKWLPWLFAGLIALPMFLLLLETSLTMVMVCLGPFLMLLLVVVALYKQCKNVFNSAIGVKGQWLLLRSGNGEVAIGSGEEILRRQKLLIIGSNCLVTGSYHGSWFDEGSYEELVEPRLVLAREISEMEWLQWQWQYRRSLILVPAVLIVVMLLMYLLLKTAI